MTIIQIPGSDEQSTSPIHWGLVSMRCRGAWPAICDLPSPWRMLKGTLWLFPFSHLPAETLLAKTSMREEDEIGLDEPFVPTARCGGDHSEPSGLAEAEIERPMAQVIEVECRRVPGGVPGGGEV